MLTMLSRLVCCGFRRRFVLNLVICFFFFYFSSLLSVGVFLHGNMFWIAVQSF